MAERIAIASGVSKASIALATRSLGSTVLRPQTSLVSTKSPNAGDQVHRLRYTQPRREVFPDTAFLEDKLRALGDRFDKPRRAFGLDHRVQYLLEQEDGHSLSRKPFYRLSQEPLVFSNWERIGRLGFTLKSATEFASLLCGKQVALRRTSIWADGPVGHVVFFDDVHASGKWLADLDRVHKLGLSPLVEAIVTYARTVIAHPFTDGNGRFARALFYSPLARAGILAAPCLALGATFDLRREAIAHATVLLAANGRWSDYVDSMLVTVEAAIGLVDLEVM